MQSDDLNFNDLPSKITSESTQFQPAIYYQENTNLNLRKDFDIIATNSDDFIEIAYNKKSKMLCLMPHPEREFYSKSLTPLIKNFLL